MKILNPKLSVSTAFSDNSDLLILTYSRLDLNGLEISVSKFLQTVLEQRDTAFAEAEIEKIDESASDTKSPSNIWDDYHNNKYLDVVEKTKGSVNTSDLKARALSLMKLGNMYEAMQTWKELLSDEEMEKSANFHIGICKYVIGDYEGALNYFQLIRTWSTEKVTPWIARTTQKISSPATLTQESVDKAIK